MNLDYFQFKKKTHRQAGINYPMSIEIDGKKVPVEVEEGREVEIEAE